MTRKKRGPADIDYDMELMSSNYEISRLFDKIIRYQDLTAAEISGIKKK